MALFVIDFDNTIIDANSHNELCQSEACDLASQRNLIQQFPPVGGKEQWQQAFKQLIVDQHQIAIASFNSFDYLIPFYLTNVIGLSEDEVQKIHVEAWLPANRKDKNTHIEHIHTLLKINAKPSYTILIDDDKANIDAASKIGYQTIHATGNHAQDIINLSRKMKSDTTFFKLFKRETIDSERCIPDARACVCIVL